MPQPQPRPASKKERLKGDGKATAKPLFQSFLTSIESTSAMEEKKTLLSALHDLFLNISSQKKKTGSVGPVAFINQLKCDNGISKIAVHKF